MKRIESTIGAALLLAAAVMAGCSKEPASEGAVTVATAKAPYVAPKPRSTTMTIPAGTVIMASLETPLSTATNNTGDGFRARAIEAVIVDGRTAVPAGAQIHGILRDVQSSGKISGRARMTLDFLQVEDSNGTTHAISADPLTLQAASKTKGDVEKIAAGGVLGAIIGGIAGGKKGALIGAGAGAGAGTVIMLATKGDEVVLGGGQRLNITMNSSASIVLVAQK